MHERKRSPFLETIGTGESLQELFFKVVGPSNSARSLKLVRTLLNKNSQFSHGNPRLNHEALCILLHHLIKPLQKQTFVLAGPEDLRVLLPRLKFDGDGDEAIVLIRPYIHSMGIYFRREKAKLHCYLFDAQAWGTRYYPTRTIINAITSQFSDACVYLSGPEIQSQANQVGCVYYTLLFIYHCVTQGSNVIRRINHSDKKSLGENYINTQQLNQHMLDDASLVEMQQPDFVDNHHERYLQMLDYLLQEHYLIDNQLDETKIAAIVDDMQGLQLISQPLPLNQPALFSLSVDYNLATLTMNFKDKADFLYGNFFIYSNELYPSAVDLERSKYLITSPDITISRDSEFTLTCKAKDVATLEREFKHLANQKNVLFNLHMRQQGALIGFIQEIEECLVLTKIQQDQTGGFDQNEVQLALKHLFTQHQNVYIPAITELLSPLPLLRLKKEGYRYLGFSMNIQSSAHHQVAVWIDLDSTIQVTIYDSLEPSLVDEATLMHLKKLLNEIATFEIKKGKSPYLSQVDDWSCGVYVIAHLLWAHQSLSAQAPIPLPVISLAKSYYRAYQHAQAALQHHTNDAETNDFFKRELLDLLETLLSSYQELKRLADFMQVELWGNLDRANPRREMQSDENRRTRSLLDTAIDFERIHREDKGGKLILYAAAHFQAGDKNTFRQALEMCCHRIFVKTIIQHDIKKDGLLYGLTGDIFNVIDDKSFADQLTYLKNIIVMLTTKDLASELIIAEICDLAECPDYFNHIKSLGSEEFFDYCVKYLLEYMLIKLINFVSDHENEEKRKQRQIEEAVSKEKIAAIKNLLWERANLSNIPEEVCASLSSNVSAHQFLKSYLDPDFFSNLTRQQVIQKLSELSQRFVSNSFNEAFLLYAGGNIRDFLLRNKDKITNLNLFLQTLRQIHINDRLFFIKSQEANIAGCLDSLTVYSIFQLLPEKNRFAFVNRYSDIINENELKFILRAFESEEKRTAILMKWIGKSNPRIIEALYLIEKNQRLAFITEHQDIIDLDHYYIQIIDALPLEERREFLKKFPIKDMPFDKLLIYFPEAEHLSIAMEWIHDPKAPNALDVLTGEARFRFIEELRKVIRNLDTFLLFLSKLPRSVRKFYAIEAKHQLEIKKINDLQQLIKANYYSSDIYNSFPQFKSDIELSSIEASELLDQLERWFESPDELLEDPIILKKYALTCIPSDNNLLVTFVEELIKLNYIRFQFWRLMLGDEGKALLFLITANQLTPEHFSQMPQKPSVHDLSNFETLICNKRKFSTLLTAGFTLTELISIPSWWLLSNLLDKAQIVKYCITKIGISKEQFLQAEPSVLEDFLTKASEESFYKNNVSNFLERLSLFSSRKIHLDNSAHQNTICRAP